MNGFEATAKFAENNSLSDPSPQENCENPAQFQMFFSICDKYN